jgi:hypothetical protein
MMAIVAPPAVYAGVREIATTGTWYRELAPVRYDVSESYSVVQWKNRVATLRGTLTFTVSMPPADGMFLTTATVEQREGIDLDGSVRLLSFHRVTHAADVRSGGTVSVTSASDERTVDVSYPAGETTIPSSLAPHEETLSLATTTLRTELNTGAFGSSAVVGISADRRVERTTAADGAFKESGTMLSAPWIHRVQQQADGSANAYDNVPGFSLHDVTVAAPDGTGPAAQIHVTVKTQGRTIGPTPIDTHDYVVPMWYATTWPTPLATATLTVERRRAPDDRCALGPAPLIPVVVERRHVDVSGEIVEERDERDVDAKRTVLCRLTTTTTRRVDVTTGYETGTMVDTTVVHLAPTPLKAG